MNLRIAEFRSDPIAEVRYLNAGRRPGAFYEDRLPVLAARVESLPEGCDAIVVTADLQGRERFREARGGPPRLLGEVLPDMLVEELLPLVGSPDPSRTGVLLAGDFYTVPALDRRGGTGDVTEVWRAFADRFAWVAGVAGNHDAFGDDLDDPPRLPGNALHLDGDTVLLEGLRVAGVGGIIGNPSRHRRRDEEEYLLAVELVLESAPDVLLLHDGPNGPTPGQRGSKRVRLLLEEARPHLVVRGHAHWREPFAELPGGVQLLNVDARCVLLTA